MNRTSIKLLKGAETLGTGDENNVPPNEDPGTENGIPEEEGTSLDDSKENEDEPDVENGDDNNWYLPMILLVISAVVLGCTTIKKRKQI